MTKEQFSNLTDPQFDTYAKYVYKYNLSKEEISYEKVVKESSDYNLNQPVETSRFTSKMDIN